MATEKPSAIAFSNVGVDDGILYSKADLVQCSRFGDNFVINFYQMDYTALAAAAQRGGGKIQETSKSMLLPVAKIVMDPGTFARMVEAIRGMGSPDKKTG